MKTKLGSLLMACAMLFCFTTSCEDPVIYDTFCSISGTVIDVDTGDLIPQATVTLSPSGMNTYTGSDGHFEFLDLEERQYTITVQKTGYQTNRKTVTTIAGSTMDVSLTLKKNS